MVKVKTETTKTTTVPLADLRRALRLPKSGRLTLHGIKVRVKGSTTWSDVDEAIPAWDDDETVVFTTYQVKHKAKKL